MDVRSIVDREPEVEHNGTVPVWYLVHPRELKDATDGGFVELINEFEVAAGGAVFPHSHPTHEWYFVMSGRGVMTVDGRSVPSVRVTSSTSRPSRSIACARSAAGPSTASASPSVSKALPRWITRPTERGSAGWAP